MKKYLKKYTYFSIALVLAFGIMQAYIPNSKANADANASDLISDSVFENTNSMSAGQIDNFLGSFSNSCISQKVNFATPDPLGYSDGAYQFGGNVTGGQAIYDIAKHYDVNPQVILTTLQKEQSIVTGADGCHYDKPNPSDPSQVFSCNLWGTSAVYNCTEACPYAYGGGCMNIAMSYDCPGNCDANIEDFSNQISGGTWLLRFAEMRSYGTLTGYPGYDPGDEDYSYNGPMTPGYRQRIAGGPSIYYDGSWTTSDGVDVSINNGATASLYNYTPYWSGNLSFINIFETTFGFGDPSTGTCTASATQLPYVESYYNSRTFEHFYSAYACDEDLLNSIGFNLEGPIFNDSPCTAGYATPVYRYYDPTTGYHFWTTDNLTKTQLSAGGTGYELDVGEVFCVAQAGMANVHPVDRLYNPKTFLHVWGPTPSASELNTLAQQAGYTENDGTVFWTQ